MVRRFFVLAAVLAVVAWGGQVFAEEAKEGTHEGKVVKAGDGKLTMSDAGGKKHTHTVSADAKITCDGKECKLEDLKKDATVKVTAEKKGDKTVVTKVEAKSAGS